MQERQGKPANSKQRQYQMPGADQSEVNGRSVKNGETGRNTMIVEITDPAEKRAIARNVLEALTDWFGIEESREEYISGSAGWTFLAAREDDHITGFLCLKETGKATVELAVMGVLKEYHRRGTGRQLVEKAKETARSRGYEFMQVKTVKMGVYEDYDQTNLFYISCGFKELEVFPLLWDERNPCQVYVMSLTPVNPE